MPKRSLETLSEPMFYVLMALRRRTLCGVEIVHWIGETTEGRWGRERCTPFSPS